MFHSAENRGRHWGETAVELRKIHFPHERNLHEIFDFTLVRIEHHSGLIRGRWARTCAIVKVEQRMQNKTAPKSRWLWLQWGRQHNAERQTTNAYIHHGAVFWCAYLVGNILKFMGRLGYSRSVAWLCCSIVDGADLKRCCGYWKSTASLKHDLHIHFVQTQTISRITSYRFNSFT